MTYDFDIGKISQHVIKYCVDVRPGVHLEQDRVALQSYANWLIERYPALFETLLSGPNQCQVNKTFVLGDGKQAQMSTFVLSPRGPVFTVPKRLFLGRPREIQTDAFEAELVESLEKFTALFGARVMPRIGIVHELIFDTSDDNSLDLMVEALANRAWHEDLRNVQIVLEKDISGKHVVLTLRPTFQSQTGRKAPAPATAKYGIIVNAEISVSKAGISLTKEQIEDVLGFSSFYVPQELVAYLGGDGA